MTKLARILRFVLFCVFFAAGTGAIALSIIANPEILDYYNNTLKLRNIERTNEKIRTLTCDYESQIQQIQNEPNVLNLLRTAVLGDQPKPDGIAYPTASPRQSEDAAAVVLESTLAENPAQTAPKWVRQISEAKNRRTLFFAGAGLVFITFLFFGSANNGEPSKAKDT